MVEACNPRMGQLAFLTQSPMARHMRMTVRSKSNYVLITINQMHRLTSEAAQRTGAVAAMTSRAICRMVDLMMTENRLSEPCDMVLV
jgi:hypothetical protein